MYPAMRRKDRALPREDAEALLRSCEYGVLSTVDENSQPYATPLSYVYENGALYFHAAQEGQKLRNIAANSRVCFCVVGDTQPVYTDGFTTYYESAMAFGHAALVEDEAEKTEILLALCRKYLPDYMDRASAYVARMVARTAVVKIAVEHLTGKAHANAAHGSPS